MMTEENEVFGKKLCLTLEWGILFAFLAEYGLVNLKILLKIYFGDWCFYHLLYCRDSKLNSSESFSVDVPRIAPVMAKFSLYWIVLDAFYVFVEKTHYMLDQK